MVNYAAYLYTLPEPLVCLSVYCSLYLQAPQSDFYYPRSLKIGFYFYSIDYFIIQVVHKLPWVP